jgi:hypothetical protein
MTYFEIDSTVNRATKFAFFEKKPTSKSARMGAEPVNRARFFSGASYPGALLAG